MVIWYGAYNMIFLGIERNNFFSKVIYGRSSALRFLKIKINLNVTQD